MYNVDIQLFVYCSGIEKKALKMSICNNFFNTANITFPLSRGSMLK